ncbi:MAM domain-containing glycosylphosphatidylinositol anchor protein 2-like isoform X1 [Magallana gigas]|uniref:MAM domain-containing glycosylphosphatidylinositol anchor protein 2-like isoform X1 n=1 Tax=Magallana gigas TaxID=29159 RepID=UPI00333E644C
MPKNILKRSVTCMFTMAREVIILLLFSIFYGTEQCENFRYTKDVSAPNAIQIITNVSTESVDYLRGSCVSECMSKIDCNAIDVCGTYCRLIRGWDSLYTEQIAATTCQRFQIECAAGQFYDRVLEACIAHDYCDFEADSEFEVSCFLTEDLVDDDGDWIRNTGSTITGSDGPTGPNAAKFGSYYKYMNAAALSKRDEIMTLVSSKAFQARSYCLTFYYHMLGSNMGDLKIFTKNGTQTAVEKWSTSGNQGDIWIQVPGIDLKLDPQTKILITAAKRENGDAGDIAVDLFELWPYPC